MGSTSGAETAYPSRAPQATPGFYVGWVRWLNLIGFLYCFVNHCLSFFHMAFVLSVRHQFTAFDCPIGIFRQFL
jgi:hypothetical protein